MIREVAAEVAGTIGAAVAPVPCTDHPPDTVAGPAVWLELADVAWAPEGWTVTHTVWIVAGDGATGQDTAMTLGTLTDAVLSALAGDGVAPRDMRATAQPARVGDLAPSAVAVTVPKIACPP